MLPPCPLSFSQEPSKAVLYVDKTLPGARAGLLFPLGTISVILLQNNRLWARLLAKQNTERQIEDVPGVARRPATFLLLSLHSSFQEQGHAGMKIGGVGPHGTPCWEQRLACCGESHALWQVPSCGWSLLDLEVREELGAPKNVPVELPIKLFTCSLQNKDRKSCVKAGKDLYVQLLGPELERRGQLQWPFPTWGSPSFSKPPGWSPSHIPTLMTSEIETHQHVSWKVPARGSIQPRPQPGRVGEPPRSGSVEARHHHRGHQRNAGQRAGPEGGKLGCWLLSARHEEGKIM